MKKEQIEMIRQFKAPRAQLAMYRALIKAESKSGKNTARQSQVKTV
jgi:hypothetical protein